MIEMIVAVSIFAITVVSLTEIFTLMLNGQRSAIASRNLQENMRYAFEVMAKEVRMAHVNASWHNVIFCPNITDGKIYESGGINGTELRFKNYHNECTVYSLDNGRIKIERDGIWGYITPDEISVSGLKFLVTDNYSTRQSFVTMKMDIETVGMKNNQNMTIQTSLSSRYY